MKKMRLLTFTIFIVCGLTLLSFENNYTNTQVQKKILLVKNDKLNNALDFYIQNTDNGEKTYIKTIENVYSGHYHNYEITNENVYIIKRIETPIDWYDELCKVNKDTSIIIFQNKGIDFRCSPNEKYLAFENNDTIYLYNLQQNYIEKKFQMNDPKSNSTSLLKWDSIGINLWGHVAMTDDIISYFKINTNTWEYEIYNLHEMYVEEVDLNPYLECIVFSDFPQFYDADDYEEFRKSDNKITLKILYFKDFKIETIDSSIAKNFKPIWINNNTLEYNDFTDKKRVVKIKN